jgi:transketolase
VTLAEPDELQHLRERARFIREETVRLISVAKTGHYASVFSAAEILATLYYSVMKLEKGDPTWSGRDRFLFGKGHAAVGLYPVLADLGFFDAAILDEYARLGNPLGDHPDMTRVPGIDFSSGSLGHALSAGLGMALGSRISGSQFNVFVLLGDGEMHEGQVWEAAMSAAHYRTSKLIAIVDRNQYSLDGVVDEVIRIEPLAQKWRAFGWQVVEVDGHDISQLLPALRAAADLPDGSEPTVLIAQTVKGKGVSFMESEIGWHLGFLDTDDERRALDELRSS